LVLPFAFAVDLAFDFDFAVDLAFDFDFAVDLAFDLPALASDLKPEPFLNSCRDGRPRPSVGQSPTACRELIGSQAKRRSLSRHTRAP
jgi:hypothetical protein